MSIFTKLWGKVTNWFDSKKTLFTKTSKVVESEIARIGTAAFYAAVEAGLSTLSSSGKLTGKTIAEAADVAIGALKAQGKSQVTAAVFSAIAAALTELHAESK